MENFLVSAPKGSALAKLYDVQLKNKPQFQRPTLADVSKTIASGGNFMGYGSGTALSAVPGGVAYNIEELNINQVTIALQKDSEFTEPFEYHVLKMRQSGLLSQSALKWLPQPKRDLPGCQLEAKQLSFDNLLFLFVILLGGVVIAAGYLAFSKGIAFFQSS